MKVPPEIILKNVKTTPEIDKLLNRGIAKLEQTCNYIINTHITIEREQGRHQTGNPYRILIDIRIPNRAAIVVSRSSKASKSKMEGLTVPPASLVTDIEPENSVNTRVELPKKLKVREEPLQALIRRTFDSARRQLEKEVEKQRGEEKTSAQLQTQAVVEKIFRDEGYGFLRSLDGQQVYFHQNSVLHDHWNNMTAGTIVRYVPELGEKGLQASTVEMVNKPGVAEMHNELHDLPTIK